MKESVRDRCTACEGEMNKITRFRLPPWMLAFSFNYESLRISKQVKLDDGLSNMTYTLKGVVYFGEFHFTARMVLENGSVWYHDGMETGKGCEYEGHQEDMSDSDLIMCRGKRATLAVYSRE